MYSIKLIAAVPTFQPFCVLHEYWGFLSCRNNFFRRGHEAPRDIRSPNLSEQRGVYCSSSWRIDPSPSMVQVQMAVPYVLAAFNLARQMTTTAIKPASIKKSFRRLLLALAPAAKMRSGTV